MGGKKINRANKLLTSVTSQNRKMGKKREKTGPFATEAGKQWHGGSGWELRGRSRMAQSIIGSTFRLRLVSGRKRNRDEDKGEITLFLDGQAARQRPSRDSMCN